jgi:hypothetical protein
MAGGVRRTKKSGHESGSLNSALRAQAGARVRAVRGSEPYWPLAASEIFFAPLLPTDASADVSCCCMLIFIEAIVMALFWSAIACISPTIDALEAAPDAAPTAVDAVMVNLLE